ncbi:protein kinase [Sorangium cellulosum]|uniref:Protein kinase n=1 Tax=Sorangium cellulosum TaxID=56 RepID=A0A2L0F1L5_SORCE|nr:serine/threonine-protein kinase [Sorangium cellulosum]AUX45427.1 protein kinase [Sorangium cellulosum]
MNTAPNFLPGTPAELGPGSVLGRYELLLPIAAGGMAMVWAARLKGTRGFQKIVAVKTMLPKLSEDDQFERMFLLEASLASQIRHPHAVEILDLGEQDGVLFLAMEWIDGVPLSQVMKTAKRGSGVPLPIAVRIVVQACAGLHAAHELKDNSGKLVGLVHRDISPQNILVTYDGRAKVVDFGVAKATAFNDSTTKAGQLKGKVSYTAPEQVRGDAIDRRVDVFAMGIVLYVLTTGKHPFRRESEGATLFAISSPDPVVPPHTFLPDYPASLEAVLLRALEKDRDQRYATANELLRALEQALPSTQRAAEEDVAGFIRELFEEQQQQTRAALTEALERAARNQLSNNLGISDVTGTSHSVVSAFNPVDSQRATPGAAITNTPDDESPPSVRPRSRALLAVVLLGLFAGGSFAVLRFRSADAPAPLPYVAAPAAPAPAAPAPAPPNAETPAPAPPTAEAPPATELGAPPGEPSAPASASAAPAPAPRPGSHASGAPRRQAKPAEKITSPSPTPSTAPPKSWKHDPGF